MQLVSLLAALAGTSSLVAAQSQGGFINAVVKLYNGGGCTQVMQADPIFGQVNACQPLPSGFTAVSANTTSVTQGCTVHLFTDLQCSQGETVAPPNHCEQASTPFKAVNVECP